MSIETIIVKLKHCIASEIYCVKNEKRILLSIKLLLINSNFSLSDLCSPRSTEGTSRPLPSVYDIETPSFH